MPPLKELGVVVLLIWAGSFLCMLPQMLNDAEKQQWADRNALLDKRLSDRQQEVRQAVLSGKGHWSVSDNTLFQ